MPHDAQAEGIDQRVARVAGVERELASDVRQSEAVPVEGDSADDARQHPPGIGRVRGPEPQGVHDRDGPRAHREDVPDDPAHAGRRALERLDVRGMVVRFDLEGNGITLADVHDAGVLADPGQQPLARRRLLAELAQVLPR